MNMIEEIFSYVKKKYGVEPDYPFSTAPDYPVLRHEDNRKWFAIIMDAPGEKLGLEDTDRVDVINVKMGDPMLADMLIQQPGVFAAITSAGETGSPFSWTARLPSKRSAGGSTRAMQSPHPKRRNRRFVPQKNGSYLPIPNITTSSMLLTGQRKSTGNRAGESGRAIRYLCMPPLPFPPSFINARSRKRIFRVITDAGF